MWGNASGGACDELRLKSVNGSFLNLRAHGGNLDFENTKVCIVPSEQCLYLTTTTCYNVFVRQGIGEVLISNPVPHAVVFAAVRFAEAWPLGPLDCTTLAL